MKTFDFSLATVMRIRRLEERLAREDLLVAMSELRRCQDSYRLAREALATCSGPVAPTTIEDVRWHHDQAARLAQTTTSCGEQLLAAASRRDRATATWRRATQRAEVLQRLHGDAWGRWCAEQQRAEVGEMDDLTNARRSWDGART